MNLTNKTGIPEVFCRAIDEKESKYTKGEAKYSVTGLMQSPRQQHLSRRHFKNIVEDYEDKLDSWIGHLMHTALEGHEDESVNHDRSFETFLGIIVSGEPDHYSKKKKRIRDYKLTSAYSWIYESRNKDYEVQLNKYGYFERKKGNPVEVLEIVYFFKDWKKSEALQNPNYPKSKIIVKQFPIWSMEDAKEYIEGRVALMESTEILSDDDLPECTPEEKWQSDSIWKVFKEGNKKSSGNFDSQLDAENFLLKLKRERPKESFEIREIPGEPKKCLAWCRVSKFCKYAPTPKEEVEQNG